MEKQNNMKKILLLGGSFQQLVAIKTAKKLGFHTVLCDYLPDNPGQYIADRYYPISTTDREKVLAIAKAEGISSILAYASDPAAPTAAYVAEQLGLPTNPFHAVSTMCDKGLFRSFLRAHGFKTPAAVTAGNCSGIKERVHGLGFPLVVKPVDASGSKGVSVVYSADSLPAAAEKAFSCSRVGRIVAEAYIENKYPHLIGGDLFVINGEVVLWGLMNCHRDQKANPLVPVGKSFPLNIDEQDLAKVKSVLRNLITTMDIRFGELNVEVMVGRDGCIYPIDIGPRSGGNMIPELISIVFGCDVVEMAIRAAEGELFQIDLKEPVENLALYVLHSRYDGILKSITFSEAIEKCIIRKELYRKPGDRIRHFENASDALGIIFLHFPTAEAMLRAEDSMDEFIQVETGSI